MKKHVFLWAIFGLVLLFLFSCRKDGDLFEKDLNFSSNSASPAAKIKSHHFLVQKIEAKEYKDLFKSAFLPNYLEDGDTVYYKTREFYKITDALVGYYNYVFSWSDGISTLGHESGIDIIVAHFYTQRSGNIDLIISADSADWTLVDTITLICSDDYPFEPVNLNQIIDTVYYVGDGYYHCEWSWLAAWNATPTSTMQAHGCVGGTITWALVDNSVVNSTKNPGYVTVGITGKNSNITPTPLGNIYWFLIHTTGNQWFTTNADRMGNYYLDTILAGESQRLNAIGFIFIDGVPLPLSFSPALPSGVASSDNKVMEDDKNIYIDFTGITGNVKYIRAINGNTSQYKDIPLTMYGATMFAQVVKDSIAFEAGGSQWIMIRLVADGQEVDISTWALYNDEPSIKALLFRIPLTTLKSVAVDGWKKVQKPSPQEVVELLWEIKYKDE